LRFRISNQFLFNSPAILKDTCDYSWRHLLHNNCFTDLPLVAGVNNYKLPGVCSHFAAIAGKKNIALKFVLAVPNLQTNLAGLFSL